MEALTRLLGLHLLDLRYQLAGMAMMFLGVRNFIARSESCPTENPGSASGENFSLQILAVTSF